MLGDLSGAESLKLICDVGEAIIRELDIFIVVSLEGVEEVAKNTDPLVSLWVETPSLTLESQSQTSLDVSRALTRPYYPLIR